MSCEHSHKPTNLVCYLLMAKTMLCNFQDFQAESSAVSFETDERKRFHLAYTGAVSAVR